MIPALLTDAEWSRLLAMASPAIDPSGELSTRIRESVDWMLWTVVGGYETKSSLSDITESFLSYAIAGEHFIRGMNAFDAFRDIIGRIDAHSMETRRAPAKPFFDKELADKIERYCVAFRKMDKFFETHFKDDIKEGPNSKPWLHAGVHHLYDLWCDELGQKARPKKDFLAFAYAVLEPLKIGITENSIQESFDRHVKPHAGLRRRMRQLGSK
jgi:hypothetical protein